MIPRCFMLKNGSTAVLRTAVPEDAAQMIAYLRACAEETDFLLRLPEEWDISVETEEALLRDMARQTGKPDAGVLGKGGDRRHLSGCLP